jgi:monofunctional glycosyltransferase
MVLADTTKPSRRRKAVSPAHKRALRRDVWRKRRRKVVTFAGRFAVNLVVALILVVFALRFINPPINYLMVTEKLRLGSIKHDWVSLDTMSPYVARSAAAAEDANYCNHIGFDLDAIRAALEDDRRLIGASTISQQTAKNVFLWPERSWLRKGFEAGFTVMIELLWGKKRIMEVYLNVAEFDEGVFGVEAAGKHYFGVPASQLSATQSARLMAILPAPRSRSAVNPGPFTRKRTSQIIAGADTIRYDGRSDCFE